MGRRQFEGVSGESAVSEYGGVTGQGISEYIARNNRAVAVVVVSSVVTNFSAFFEEVSGESAIPECGGLSGQGVSE